MAKRTARRHYFVQHRFQGRFIAAFCLLALIGALVAAAACGLAVNRALGAAKFRAHFVEQSTGEIVLPVLLRVNCVVALAVIAFGVLAAVYVFRRTSRVLDGLCSRLAQWQSLEAEAVQGEAPVSAPTPPTGAASPSVGWAADVARAICDAENALRATYRAVAKEASEMESAAGRVEVALSGGASEGEVAAELDAVSQRIAGMEAGLARCQGGDDG